MNIQHKDAIITIDEQGRLAEPDWPDADVIIGNPPFLGGSKLRRELGQDYAESLWRLYSSRVPGGGDLVTYWFERARGLVATGKAKRAGLIATNSIRGGLNRRVLERIKATGAIFMAWSDRPWVLEGAAVRVSMVGFDNGSEQARTLDGHLANEINADLTGTLDLTLAQPLPENTGLCFRTDEKGGPFNLDANLAAKMLNAPINPNGRLNSDVVRPYVQALKTLP